jgi:hypothetical protein
MMLPTVTLSELLVQAAQRSRVRRHHGHGVFLHIFTGIEPDHVRFSSNSHCILFQNISLDSS